MEVWVRSQDKEVFANVKSVRFCTMKKHKLAENTSTIHKFVALDDAYCVECNGEFFGEYPTKDRCLEIIDEIQSLFCDFLVCKDVDFGDLDLKKELGLGYLIYHSRNLDDPNIEYHERSSIVYEMPKE